MTEKQTRGLGMATRLGRYLLNSLKVAIIGFCWLMLFQVPWESLPKAPLGGKLIAAVMVWAVWSFMVMIVSVELGKEGGDVVRQGKEEMI